MNGSERYMIPAAGLRVVDPATGQPLPAEGATVVDNAEYWVRRMNDGDATEGKPPAKSKASTTKPSQE